MDYVVLVFIYLFFAFSRATPAAYGGSQAQGRIGATAAGLHHSHSKAGSKTSLQPTPQLTAMPDPHPTEQGQGSNLKPYGPWSDSLTTAPRWELQYWHLK